MRIPINTILEQLGIKDLNFRDEKEKEEFKKKLKEMSDRLKKEGR